MSIPLYHELFPAIMEISMDNKIRTNREMTQAVINFHNLSDEDRNQLLPSGKQTVINNRSNWAAYYLRRAGLLKSEKRGHSQISSLGRKYVEEHGYNIVLNDLYRFESFREFINKENDNNVDNSSNGNEKEKTTPEEVINEAFLQLEQQLSDDLLSEIMNMPPVFFEVLVLDLLIAMGYGGRDKKNSKLTKLSNDEGIDGLIKEDELGLEYIYVQAKRWKDVVGRKEIQSFVGALSGFGALKGVFITTSKFSASAREYVNKQLHTKVVLIDGDKLTKLMIAYDVGLSVEKTYHLKKIDRDYFNYED